MLILQLSVCQDTFPSWDAHTCTQMLTCMHTHTHTHTHTHPHTPHIVQAVYGLLSSLHVPLLTFTICLLRPWVETTGLHLGLWCEQ